MCVPQKVLVHQDASLHTAQQHSASRPDCRCSLLMATVLMTESTPRFTVSCSSQLKSHTSCLGSQQNFYYPPFTGTQVALTYQPNMNRQSPSRASFPFSLGWNWFGSRWDRKDSCLEQGGLESVFRATEVPGVLSWS